MSALLLAVLLLGEPPAATAASPAPATPASPAPAASPSPAPAPDAKDKSLGAVAKRTTAAGKKAAPPKVLTNDDLEKSRQGGAAVSVLAADGVEGGSGGSASGEGRFNSEADNTNIVLQDEATWRQRADAARMRIADADANFTQAEQRLAELRSDLTADDTMNPYREQNRAAEITTQMERVDASRAEAAAARQAMSDLEEEARRASVPPGWLRER